MTRPTNLYEAGATVQFRRDGDEYTIAIRGLIDGQEAGLTRRFRPEAAPNADEFAELVELFLKS